MKSRYMVLPDEDGRARVQFRGRVFFVDTLLREVDGDEAAQRAHAALRSQMAVEIGDLLEESFAAEEEAAELARAEESKRISAEQEQRAATEQLAAQLRSDMVRGR